MYCVGVVPLHELGRPFSDAEGPGVLAGLRFDEDNTLTDRPMVTLLEHLTAMLDHARQAAPRSGAMSIRKAVFLFPFKPPHGGPHGHLTARLKF